MTDVLIRIAITIVAIIVRSLLATDRARTADAVADPQNLRTGFCNQTALFGPTIFAEHPASSFYSTAEPGRRSWTQSLQGLHLCPLYLDLS